MASSSTKMFAVFFMVLSLSALPSTTALVFEVCDGLDLWSPTANIPAWLTSLPILHVGDKLHFTFTAPTTVVVVNALAYAYCDASHPIAKDVSGSFTFTLNTVGLFSFISDGPGQCGAGLKLQVLVAL